jgi:hypothetical protein
MMRHHILRLLAAVAVLPALAGATPAPSAAHLY